tara:strand:- start:1725 stop:2408 length:684 start_codon:yes stop_codon:yes gene_type:complete
MSSYLYLDIETIPSQDTAVHERIAATITPPGTLKKPESIAEWEAEKKPAAVKEAIAKTSFDGALGHICCIGWAVGDQEPKAVDIGNVDNEKRMLEFFVNAIHAQSRQLVTPTVVGHNVVDFDIRFIWQRAIILGVRLPGWFPRDPKPWGDDTFDTMTAFAGARNRISMDNLCRALGIPGKGEVDGSMVAGMWERGEFAQIAHYCREDVERTRAIHKRMMIAFGQEAA